MSRTHLLPLIVGLFISTASWASEPCLPERQGQRGLEVDRSPVDLALSTDGTWLATANQTSNSVSLVRIHDGRVLDEVAVGTRPAAVALLPNQRQLLVSSQYAGELTLLEVVEDKLVTRLTVAVGFEPLGLAVSPDGRLAYVCLSAADCVAVIDLTTGEVTDRIVVGRQPRYLGISPDGSRLVIGVAGERGVVLVNAIHRKVLAVDRFTGLNLGQIEVSADGRHTYFPWMVYRRNPITAGNIRLGWVLASRLARLPLFGEPRREAISLDPPGRAVADPHGIALTSDASRVVVSAGGTHELLVFANETLPYLDRGGTDHIDPELLNDSDRFYRIEVGGRPLAIRMARDDRTVYVANYLKNCVQIVDLQQRSVVREMALGGDDASSSASPARRGEALFYDARRSLDQWYSCHSCHYEGGSNAVTMDTQNDGSRFTFKTVLPLFQVDRTGPWNWHGWQTRLEDAIETSFTQTMLGPQPTDEDVAAVVAYLKALPAPPNAYRLADGSLSKSAERGKQVFESGRAGCATCHRGPYYTDGQSHDVGLGSKRDAYQGFNTPSLLGVHRKLELLHDGRSTTLDELLSGPHAPESVAGEPLTEDARRDLIEFIKSL